MQKNLFSKLLRIDKKKFYVFDYVEKNYNCSVEVRKIYKQDYKEFLFILKKFKLLGFNNKHLKSYNICNRTFKFETINFFRTRYFFQIMHDEIFLLKKIKIYVNFNYNNSISIQTNNFNKEKENILSTKLYIYKLFSLPKIFINIKIQNKNLCKKLYETSELVLNFTWYIKKNVMNFFFIKNFLLKSNNLLELKFFKLSLYFLNSFISSNVYQIVEYFLISFSL